MMRMAVKMVMVVMAGRMVTVEKMRMMGWRRIIQVIVVAVRAAAIIVIVALS